MINQPFIRASNIQKFTPMISEDEVMKILLGNPSEGVSEIDQKNIALSDENVRDIVENSDDVIAEVLTVAFHSLTTNVMTTKEIIENIYKSLYDLSNKIFSEANEIHKQKYRNSVIEKIARDLVIVHEDYNINIPKNFGIKNGEVYGETIKISATPFCIKKEFASQRFSYTRSVKDKKGKTKSITENFFGFEKKFGLLGYKATSIKNKNPTISLVDDLSTDQGSSEARDKIFTIRDIIESKLEAVNEIENSTANSRVKKKKGKQTKQNEDGTLDLSDFLNKVDSDNLKVSKDSTSLSYIMLNSPFIRTGTKNSLEIANFMSNINTVELSKCYPYLDVKFLLPEFVTTKSEKIYKTASVTQFLQGTPISDSLTTSTYKVLEASFVKEVKKTRNEDNRKSAVETNMSAFTMPQTAVNFDETRVGHLENNLPSKDKLTSKDLFIRNNAVHDYTKPFMTIKSFNVDIAPTAGLMSFKTGRLSLILHDKSRMADIAPFIKPDLFGSFGAEIAIQYGWSHMDSKNMGKKYLSAVKLDANTNYFAEFLESNKVYEKYIVTNSSYSIDANGQVNIDLSIAMKGPIELRSITFETDTPKKISAASITRLKERIEKFTNKIDGRNSDGKQLDSLANFKLKYFNIAPASVTSILNNCIQEFNSNTEVTKKNKLVNISSYIKTLNTVRSDFRKSEPNSNERAIAAMKGLAELGIIATVKLDKGRVKVTDATEDQKKKYKFVTDASVDETTIVKDKKNVIKLYSDIASFIRSCSSTITGARNDLNKTVKTLLSKLTSGISNEDPFYDKSIVEDLECIEDPTRKTEYSRALMTSFINNNLKSGASYFSKTKGIQSNNVKSKELTNYVSLGNFILAVIGSHVAYSGSFDEIQIVSYTLNNNAGLAANSNISSLLIDKDKLTDYIYQLFQNGAQYTLENLLMQVIKKFATTRFCVNYGLSDFYELDDNNNVVPKEGKSDKSKREFEIDVNERIRKIHDYRKKQLRLQNDSFFPEIKFVLPKIKLLFDSVTRSSGTESILRISIIDQHDNPFESTTQIMNKVYEKGVPSAIYDINKRLIALKSLAKDKKDIQAEKAKFIKENKEIIDKLVKEKILTKDNNGDYTLNSLTPEDNFATSIKNSLKTIMPSVTYGTNNSAVLEASISTINEAKLNTVYITRPNRNSAPIKSKVKYKQDLPLRILPSQVNMTIFGCPFMSFAQYLFLDFETNTTVDNQYIVTGLKHDITPGKFTTSLTLSYGDAYGKYETIVDTLNRTLKEIETGEVEAPNSKQTYSGVDIVKNLSVIFDESISLDTTSADPIYKYNPEALGKLGWTDATRQSNNENNKSDDKNEPIYITGLDRYKIRKYNVGNTDSAFYNIKAEIVDDNRLKLNFKDFTYYINDNDKSQNKVMYIDIFKKFKTLIPNSDFASKTFQGRNIDEKDFSYFIMPNGRLFYPEKNNNEFIFDTISARELFNENTDHLKTLIDDQVIADIGKAKEKGKSIEEATYKVLKNKINKRKNKNKIQDNDSFLTDLLTKNKSVFYELDNLLNKPFLKIQIINLDNNNETKLVYDIVYFHDIIVDDIDNVYADRINALLKKIKYEYVSNRRRNIIEPIFHPDYPQKVTHGNDFELENVFFKGEKITIKIKSKKKTQKIKKNKYDFYRYQKEILIKNFEASKVPDYAFTPIPGDEDDETATENTAVEENQQEETQTPVVTTGTNEEETVEASDNWKIYPWVYDADSNTYMSQNKFIDDWEYNTVSDSDNNTSKRRIWFARLGIDDVYVYDSNNNIIATDLNPNDRTNKNNNLKSK